MPSLKIPVTNEDHIQGSPKAPITLVQYGDYQCPYCGKAYPIIKRVQAHFGDNLRFVFRNFPLTEEHPFAKLAAVTAEFASSHGLFWKMHDLIYENQSQLSQDLFLELTKKMGLSISEFEKAILEDTFEPKIEKDFIGGVKSGVNGTPTFFINGERHDGSFEFPALVTAIDRVLVEKTRK